MYGLLLWSIGEKLATYRIARALQTLICMHASTPPAALLILMVDEDSKNARHGRTGCGTLFAQSLRQPNRYMTCRNRPGELFAMPSDSQNVDSQIARILGVQINPESRKSDELPCFGGVGALGDGDGRGHSATKYVGRHAGAIGASTSP
jgi:hypothetical protein